MGQEEDDEQDEESLENNSDFERTAIKCEGAVAGRRIPFTRAIDAGPHAVLRPDDWWVAKTATDLKPPGGVDPPTVAPSKFDQPPCVL